MDMYTFNTHRQFFLIFLPDFAIISSVSEGIYQPAHLRVGIPSTL